MQKTVSTHGVGVRLSGTHWHCVGDQEKPRMHNTVSTHGDGDGDAVGVGVGGWTGTLSGTHWHCVGDQEKPRMHNTVSTHGDGDAVGVGIGGWTGTHWQVPEVSAWHSPSNTNLGQAVPGSGVHGAGIVQEPPHGIPLHCDVGVGVGVGVGDWTGTH